MKRKRKMCFAGACFFIMIFCLSVMAVDRQGTKKIEGTGENISFDTLSGGLDYFLTEVYKETTGEEPESLTEASWCQPVIDRVTNIVVEEGVTVILNRFPMPGCMSWRH